MIAHIVFSVWVEECQRRFEQGGCDEVGRQD
jgi:hypothetical protein